MNKEHSPNIDGFLKTLRNENANYFPLAELGIHPKIKKLFLNKSIINLKDEIEFWHNAGYDYIKIQPKADFNPQSKGLDKNVSYNDDGTIFRKWASETKGVITCLDDYERYLFPSSADFNYSNFEKAGALLPTGLGVVAQYGDIFTMTWEMMGFESFSIALFENEELVELLNSRLGNLVISMFEYFVQSPVTDAIWYSDDIAYTNGLLVSPDVLDKYFFPWLKIIGDMAKQYNKPLIFHSDGILYDVMDKIIECGVSAIHPIEPKAMNIADVKQKFGDKLCLIGNIDVDILTRGTVREIKENVYRNIELVGNSGGYCVGSGNSIPEYVKLENYVAMIEAVKEINSQL